MATFSGNSDFFKLINKIDLLTEKITLKKNDIEKIKLEYGINEHEIENINSETEENISTSKLDSQAD
jgi:Cu/Ag efflux protein CusF